MTPEARLEVARAAFQAMVGAEANIARLSRYAHPNKTMLDDLARHRRRLDEARAKLASALTNPAAAAALEA
jgi:hypothetical protein